MNWISGKNGYSILSTDHWKCCFPVLNRNLRDYDIDDQPKLLWVITVLSPIHASPYSLVYSSPLYAATQPRHYYQESQFSSKSIEQIYANSGGEKRIVGRNWDCEKKHCSRMTLLRLDGCHELPNCWTGQLNTEGWYFSQFLSTPRIFSLLIT